MTKRPYPWKCGKCRERKVFPVTVDYSTELEHDGRTYPIRARNLEILRCEACGNEMLPDAAYEKLNEALRYHANLLMPSQITEKREALGLSQREFAWLFGVAPETANRWEKGAQIQQRVMNDFMNAFFDLPELREYLRRLRGAPAGVGPTTPEESVTNSTPLQTIRPELAQALYAADPEARSRPVSGELVGD